MQMQQAENWKRALMVGSFAAAAILILTGKRPAAFALAGIGLATLATEHPEKVKQIWESAPEYLEKGTRVVSGFGNLVDKVAEHGARFQSARGRTQGHDYLT